MFATAAVCKKPVLIGVVVLPLAMFLPVLDVGSGSEQPFGVAFAQDEGQHQGGSGGGGGSGQHQGGGGGGGGQHQGGQGPNPNCPYQDHSGRGGFGPGRAGHQGGTPGAAPTQGTASSDPGITGGGAGGEGFVCDAPKGGGIVNRVFRR